MLEFEPGIVSIVGPNGSGKSNFSDAIRWVLGEQSMKAIRSKKSEDVIFAGSDKKAKLGMAEVSIIFDNEDRQLPIDFPEVVITRRLYRDGESDYMLNKRIIRLMDITELLAKSGYGGYSYHIISQGSIDQLVLAGPAAIKNLIEEACGVKPYYIKRSHAVRKLDRTEENLRRVADLVAEIEPRLRSLRRQTKRMEQREQLAEEMKQLQSAFFGGQYHRFQDDLRLKKQSVKQFDEQIAQIDKELQELSGRLKTAEDQTGNTGSSAAKLQEDLRRMEREKNIIQEQLATARGQLKAGTPLAGGDAQSLQLRKQEEAHKFSSIEGQIHYYEGQISTLEKQLADHRRIYDRLEADTQKLKRSIEESRSPIDLESLKMEIDRVYNRFQQLLYSIQNIESEDDRRHAKQDAENVEIMLVKLKNRFKGLSGAQFSHADLLEVNAKLQQLFGQKEALSRDMGSTEASLSAAKLQKEFFTRQKDEIKHVIDRIEQELKGADPVSADEHWKKLMENEKELTKKLQQYVTDIQKLETDLKKFLENEGSLKKELFDLERQYRAKQDELVRTKDQKNLVAVERVRIETNIESLNAEIRVALGEDGFRSVCSSQKVDVDPGIEHKIYKLKAQLDTLGGIDDLTLQEYRETEARYKYLTEQSDDLSKAVSDLKHVVTELDMVIKRQFVEGFDRINEQFSENFRILFSGGRARMSLVKQDVEEQEMTEEAAVDQEEEKEKNSRPKEEIAGIEIRAVPPGKKLSSLSALSGGERTMTAIALLMAILSAFPSPFVVLDEVDAALDEANTIRFGKILEKLSHQTQFITITHNRETMRQSKMLYGITMGDDGISKVLSIKLDRAVEMAE